MLWFCFVGLRAELALAPSQTLARGRLLRLLLQGQARPCIPFRPCSSRRDSLRGCLPSWLALSQDADAVLRLDMPFWLPHRGSDQDIASGRHRAEQASL